VEKSTACWKEAIMTKGVIIAAGYGTRFLPITKSIPKEMLPLVNRPAIEFIVNEFLDSGIEDILIISSRRKKAMEDYFDRDLELEAIFQQEGAVEKLQKIMRVSELADVHFIRQKEMRGTAHAIYLAHSFIGNESFVVAYPDDLFICKIPLTKQLVDLYEKTDKNVLSILEIPKSEVSRYGIVEPEVDRESGILYIKGIVEKPLIDQAPSSLMSAGRYLFKPEILRIFKRLIDVQTGKGESTQTPGIEILAKERQVVGHIIQGERLDIGQPLEYIKAFSRYALSQPEFQKQYIEFLEKLNL
jgi:UTP--glucose-1-phosphate uridylyltransferase